MKSLIPMLSMILTITMLAQTNVMAINPKSLAQEKGCFACHSINHKMVGPSWKDISAKYQHNLKYIPYLAKMIRHGNVGAFGPIPMPPQNNITKKQAEEIAKFILSLK